MAVVARNPVPEMLTASEIKPLFDRTLRTFVALQTDCKAASADDHFLNERILASAALTVSFINAVDSASLPASFGFLNLQVEVQVTFRRTVARLAASLVNVKVSYLSCCARSAK
jgi:hypothetical protein